MAEEEVVASTPNDTPVEPEAAQSPMVQSPAPEAQITRLQEQLSLAVSRYRTAQLARYPEIPQELVSGDTVEAVDASLSAARDIVEKVRLQLEAQASAERVPAGAPARSPADLSALSPAEKIAYALSRGR